MQAIERTRTVLPTIVCPACHSRLTLSGTTVNCDGCGRSYPIEDGIPVLLVDRAATPQKSTG